MEIETERREILPVCLTESAPLDYWTELDEFNKCHSGPSLDSIQFRREYWCQKFPQAFVAPTSYALRMRMS